MLMGVIFALIMFWISKLSYWRVHAQRCDLRLLVLPRHPPHYNAFFKELNGEDESDQAAKEASTGLMRLVPQITLWRVLKSLANGGVRLRMMGSHLTGNTVEGRSKKEDASLVVSGALAPSLPTAPTNSRVLPLPQPSVAVGGTTYSRTFSANIGGQRCVWTRHPPLARRVLHTHFRIFPITSAALAVQRLLGNEAVIGGHVDAPLDTAAFPLASRELYFDHVSWLGDAAPGVLPDVPLLFLTTTALQRQQARARSGVSIADDAETLAARELFLAGVVRAHRQALKEPVSCTGETAQFASAFALCSQELLFGDVALTNAAVASRLTALVGARLGQQQPGLEGALFDAGCSIAAAVNMPNLESTQGATYWSDVAPLGAAFVLGFNLSIPATLNALARKVYPRHDAAVAARDSAAFLFDLAAAAAVVDVLVSRVAQHKAGAKNLPSPAFRGLQAALDATFKRPAGASGFRLDDEPSRKAFYAPFVDPAKAGADAPASAEALLGLKLALLEAAARAGGLEALIAQKKKAGLAAAAAAATAQGIPADDTASRVACVVALLDACWDAPMRAVLRTKCLSILLHTARAAATHAQLVLTVVGGVGAGAAPLKGAANLRSALTQGFAGASATSAPSAAAIRQSRAVARCALRETLRLRPPVDICARMAETDDPVKAVEMLDCKVGPDSVPKRAHSTTGKPTNGERDSNDEAYHQDSWKTGDQSVDMAAVNGVATLPSSAVVVVDIGGMQRDASAFGAGDEFEWRRWVSHEKEVASDAASGRADSEFYAPFGFGASAEAALAMTLEAGSSLVVAALTASQ